MWGVRTIRQSGIIRALSEHDQDIIRRKMVNRAFKLLKLSIEFIHEIRGKKRGEAGIAPSLPLLP